MTAPINFQDPIETLFQKIEDGVRYAGNGLQPYMESQYVNITFLLILNTGAIPEACREWHYRTPVNQTWGTSAGNLHALSMSNASFLARPAVLDTTLQMWLSTMCKLRSLLMVDL
jgi:hypothetical protein